jgi:hypothetical protein
VRQGQLLVKSVKSTLPNTAHRMATYCPNGQNSRNSKNTVNLPVNSLVINLYFLTS